MLESTTTEVEEKEEPKRVALSGGETAIVSSEWKSVREVEQQLLEILLAKDQKDLSVEEEVITIPT